MTEVLAQRGRMIGIDASVEAGAGYRNLSKPRIDEVGVYRDIDMNQHSVSGEPLGAVAGDRVAVIEMPVVSIGERNGAAVVETHRHFSRRGNLLNGGKVPVCYPLITSQNAATAVERNDRKRGRG
jgi:hypothetical protein